MKGRFRITYKDGTSTELEAENADAAKTAAKNAAYTKLDPGGSMSIVDRRRHPSVQVAQVEELVANVDRARDRGRDDRDTRDREERERQGRTDRDTRDREEREGNARGGTFVPIVLAVLSGLILHWIERTLLPTEPGVLTAGVLSLFAAKGTAINTTIAALAAVTGDSLTVPHFPDTKKGSLLQLWADVQTAGTLRIRSPKMHDNVNGIRIDTIASDPTPLLPFGVKTPLYSGDPLIVELAGSATAGDEEFICLLAYYEELSAQHSRLITPDEVNNRIQNLVTVENSITTLTTGIWTGAEAINSEIDQFQHGDDYAILGYKVDTECAAVRYRAPDFANVGLGGPGVETDPELTADWFLRLSRGYGLPLVPVFNSANKSSVFVEALQDENGADVVVTTFLARLKKG